MPVFRIPPAPFRGIRSTAPALSGATEADTTFTAAASLMRVANSAFTTSASLSGTIDVAFTTAASLANQVDSTFTASASIYYLIDKEFTASASLSGSPSTPFTASASLVRLGARDTSFSAAVSLSLIDEAAAQAVVFPIEHTQTHYELRLVHQSGGFYLDMLDRVLAFDYTLVINDVSVCNLTLPGDYPLSYLAKDNRIEIWRSVGDGPLQLEGDTQFLIQTVVREVDANGAKTIKVTAYSLNDILRRRVVAFSSDTIDYGYLIGEADTLLYNVINNNLGYGNADTDRILDGTFFSIETMSGTTPTLEMDVSWKYLLDVMKDIANASFTGGTPLFFEIVCIDPPNGIQFQMYINQRGVDRRASSGNPLILSQANGSIGAYSITEDWSNDINYVYAFGPGDGDLQMQSTQEDTTRRDATLFSRREYVYSNQDADDLVALDSMAKAVLAQSRPRKLFSGTVLNVPGVLYGRDWKIGYWVTAEDADDSFDCFVAAVQVSVDSTKEDVQATLRNDFSWT